jgi:hypothetical protein
MLKELPYLDFSDLVSVKPFYNLQSLLIICKAFLQSTKSFYNLQRLFIICDDLRSFFVINLTNSSFINDCEPYI